MTSIYYPARCIGAVAITLALLSFLPATAQQQSPVRKPADDVKDAQVREAQGLKPNENLLFNGWGVTPAGQHVTISDLPLKLVVSPDKKMLLAASAGFNDPGLSLLDIASRRVTQFLPLERIWNGLAFSLDGRRIFVSGGDSGKVHVFKYADGKATSAGFVKPSPNAAAVFLAGIAVHPATGKVYVCNEANDEIWVLNAQTLALETTVAVGEHPHSCVFGADKRHLYVSNWGSRSVSVVDTKENRRVRNIPVGIRPNDMALAPDGRLFVACSGDNTVHVIQTQNGGKAGARGQPETPPAGGRPRDHLHLALSRLARGQHARWRGGLAGRQDALRRQRGQQQRDGGGYFKRAVRRRATQPRIGVGRERLHPGRLVSERGVRQPGQPDALRRQRQGLGLPPELPAPQRSADPEDGPGRIQSHRNPARGLGVLHQPAQPGADGRLHRTGPAQFALHAPGRCIGRPSPARASSPTRSASRARSSTCSTSSRRTAPTTRCSAI